MNKILIVYCVDCAAIKGIHIKLWRLKNKTLFRKYQFLLILVKSEWHN